MAAVDHAAGSMQLSFELTELLLVLAAEINAVCIQIWNSAN